MRNHTSSFRSDIPVELRLLAACCDKGQSDRVDRLCDRIDDWQAFDKAAQRHNLSGFVQAAIGGDERVPEKLRRKWAHQVRSRLRFNLLQARETVQFHRSLEDAGVPNIVLKGLPLAQRIYGSIALKRSSDIDLLVSPQDANSALATLNSLGFISLRTGKPVGASALSAAMRHFKEVTLTNAHGVIVDLHWRLMDEPNMLRGIRPFENSLPTDFMNLGPVRVLGPADEFAYLCAHGMHSDWSRLKWLADVHAFIASHSSIEIDDYLNHAIALGARPAIVQAMGLRKMLWGMVPPLRLIASIEDFERNDLLAPALRRMGEPYSSPSFATSLRRIRTQARIRTIFFGSRRLAFSQAGKTLIMQKDVLSLPLPQWLDWMEFVIRPISWLLRRR